MLRSISYNILNNILLDVDMYTRDMSCEPRIAVVKRAKQDIREAMTAAWNFEQNAQQSLEEIARAMSAGDAMQTCLRIYIDGQRRAGREDFAERLLAPSRCFI